MFNSTAHVLMVLVRPLKVIILVLLLFPFFCLVLLYFLDGVVSVFSTPHFNVSRRCLISDALNPVFSDHSIVVRDCPLYVITLLSLLFLTCSFLRTQQQLEGL